MKDKNKRLLFSCVSAAILFAIGSMRFYSRGDMTGTLIYGIAGLAFLVIAAGKVRAP